MREILLITDTALGGLLAPALGADARTLDHAADPASAIAQHCPGALVYAPPTPGRTGVPDPNHARLVFDACAAAGIRHVMVLSSAAVYAPHHHNRGLLTEDCQSCRGADNAIADAWRDLE